MKNQKSEEEDLIEAEKDLDKIKTKFNELRAELKKIEDNFNKANSEVRAVQVIYDIAQENFLRAHGWQNVGFYLWKEKGNHIRYAQHEAVLIQKSINKKNG